MDIHVSRLLHEWGLSSYTPVFEANNINLATLSMLDNFLVKELIGPVGDRAKFLKNLENWKKITLTNEADISTSTSNDEFVDLLNPSHRKILSVSEFITPLNTQIANNEDGEDANTSTNNNDINTGTNWTFISDVDLEVKNTLPLQSLLEKSMEGRALLNLYKEEGKLSSNGRRKLCNIIIKDLIEKDPMKRIDSTLLLEKAQEIKDLFNKENISTYFIPYINDKNIKIKRCAKGKLYDCLQNRRRELREANLIQRKKENTSSKLNSSDLQEAVETENCNDDLLWLESCSDPWHTVVEKWQRTAGHRLNNFNTSNMSIDIYVKKFPALNTPRGHELLTADFEYMYPSSHNKLCEIFPILKQKLFKLALAKCQYTEVKEILEQYQLLKKGNSQFIGAIADDVFWKIADITS